MEYERYLNLGLDGYFTDFPASLRRFFEAKRAEHLLGNLQQVREERREWRDTFSGTDKLFSSHHDYSYISFFLGFERN